MKIIGNESYLAFKYEEVESLNGYLYGHFAFIINNCLIGNYNEISTLSICNSYLRDFLSFKSKRVFAGSETITKEDIFYEIYEAFYTAWDKKNARKISEYRDIFWLDEVGEYSLRDKIGMILLDEPSVNRQRIIWKNLKVGELMESILPVNYFDETAIKYLSYF